MSKPLAGIKVVEVAMWAFVPAAGGILADMGAEVIKVEPPSGDPIRGLQTGLGAASAVDYSFESYNRGKRSITLDLKQEAGRAVLHRLLEQADVMLTSLLPPARQAMGIDAETLRARFPNLIYASGSALGPSGPESDKGGYDAVTFWGRGGIASSLTGDDAERPIGPPGPAFGDTLSGAMLAGGVCAAVAKRALTGEASSVDVSLLGAAMWSLQRVIMQAADQGIDRFPRGDDALPNNVLSNTYKTSDGRFIALCMLQADKYWGHLCEVAGRAELANDPRFVDAAARKANVGACLGELNALFASRPLAEWREILSRQRGQWEVVQHVGELSQDEQAKANRYVQPVAITSGRTVQMVSVPMQFDGATLDASGAPEVGEHSDAILADLGYDEDAVIDLKVTGVVF